MLIRIVWIGSFLTILVFVANIFQALCVPLLLISKDLYRTVEGFIVESILGTCCVVLRYGASIDLQFVGDSEIIAKLLSRNVDLKNVLVLSNHASFVDWWVIYFIPLGTLPFFHVPRPLSLSKL
jgi:hypothetical protein